LEILKEKINLIKNITTPVYGLRKGEEAFVKRLEVAFEDLNCVNRNA
jgi:fructose-bisphosphate aldolase class II